MRSHGFFLPAIHGNSNGNRISNCGDGGRSGAKEENDDNNFEENEVGNEDETTEVVDESKIIMGTTKRHLRCRLENVNELCFINIVAHGRGMMEKENLMITRCRKGKRNTCMIDFYKNVYKESTTNTGVDVVQTTFDNFRNKID